MPLENSRSKSKDKKKKKEEEDKKKKVASKSSVKTASKDSKVSQVAKQSVVVNVNTDGVVKRRRGRPRKQKSAPPSQTKPPQFVVAPQPQSGLTQQIFSPLPQQNYTQPRPPTQPQNFTRTNPLAPTASVSLGTQTLNQDAVRRRLSASVENPLLSASEFVSTGLIPPPISSRVSPLAPPTSPRATAGFTEEQLDFMKRIRASFDDTPLKALKKRLKARIPVSIEEIDEDEASVLSDRDYTAYERIRGFNELDLLAREMRKNRNKSIPETKRIRIGSDEVLRSHPPSTLGKKPTDKDFEILQPDILVPPEPRDLRANVYNPPDTAVSVVRPKTNRRLKIVGTTTIEEMRKKEADRRTESSVPKPDRPSSETIDEKPIGDEAPLTHAVAFSMPSPTDPMKIDYIFNVQKQAKDFEAYMKSGTFPSQSGQFDLRGRRIGSIDTMPRMPRQKRDDVFRGRSPASRSEMSSPERNAKTYVMELFNKAGQDSSDASSLKKSIVAFMDEQESEDVAKVFRQAVQDKEKIYSTTDLAERLQAQADISAPSLGAEAPQPIQSFM